MSSTADADDAAELARRASQFPNHRIGREFARGRTRYIARGRELHVHPYLVISQSIDELCDALAADDQQPAKPRGGAPQRNASPQSDNTLSPVRSPK